MKYFHVKHIFILIHEEPCLHVQLYVRNKFMLCIEFCLWDFRVWKGIILSTIAQYIEEGSSLEDLQAALEQEVEDVRAEFQHLAAGQEAIGGGGS